MDGKAGISSKPHCTTINAKFAELSKGTDGGKVKNETKASHQVATATGKPKVQGVSGVSKVNGKSVKAKVSAVKKDKSTKG